MVEVAVIPTLVGPRCKLKRKRETEKERERKRRESKKKKDWKKSERFSPEVDL